MEKEVLEIVIVHGGMPFGPETQKHKSLGGSESAALNLAKKLRERDHIVTVFTNLPEAGRPDHFPSGGLGADRVRYVHLEQYPAFITSTEVDLLIGMRSPEVFKLNHQARRAVLWVHDLATYNGPSKALADIAWNIDEIWCVSDFQAEQWAEVTGYPRERIAVLRNAILPQPDIIPFGRSKNQLLYAARPERGLEALVRPGGIMARLPEFKLVACTYDNFHPSMKPLYDRLFGWMQQLPNAEFVGSLTNAQLRQLMYDSAAYVYPTEFEETSCIIAQEAMDARLPFLYSPRGALPETLGSYGNTFHSDHPWNSDEYCEDWARFIRNTMSDHEMFPREPGDNPGYFRFWEDAAKDVETLFYAMEGRDHNAFSRAWSLIEDSDIVAAKEYMDHFGRDNPGIHKLKQQLAELYPYLYGRESFADYYERYFVREDSKGARQRRSMVGNPRFEVISQSLADLAPGATVLDYGCAEGVIILDLAQHYPNFNFIGVDFAGSNVELCQRYAREMGLRNVEFYKGSTDDFPVIPRVDATICTEVLEHVERPWDTIYFLETRTKVGGKIIITVPMGPWESIGLRDKDQFQWRAHIWHINKWMLRTMFAEKEGCSMQSLPGGAMPDGRALGHTLFTYVADHRPVKAVSPFQKAMRHRVRETVTAAMIVNDTDMLMRTLKSLKDQVQVIRVVTHSPAAVYEVDGILTRYCRDHPWIFAETFAGPEIKPRKYGFDDARNDSVRGVYTDWVLWIDSDEYISGDFRRYLRHNAFDSYAITQHHFTCDPRGAPAQMDRPARLYRVNRGFTFFGKVHEHAEKGFNNGPGFCMMLGDVDLGHVGYVNENTRRARFSRNFPLMEWDHEVNPTRHLSKFLWLRDIVHRMRYFMEVGDPGQAHSLAQEAVQYYEDKWTSITAPGMGGEMAYKYYSEALAFLGRGTAIAVQLDISGEATTITGVFENEEKLAHLIKDVVKDKFKARNSPYWS